jgi:hypothetical protein
MAPTDAQTLIIRLPATITRQVTDYVDRHDSYRSVSEFAAVALANQLALENDASGLESNPPSEPAVFVSPVAGEPYLSLDPDLSFTGGGGALPVNPEPLSPLTNRLFPMKLACRVIGSEAAHDGLDVDQLHEVASGVARKVGLWLRQEDRSKGFRANQRRWIALPVGEDERAARERFAAHFTLHLGPDGTSDGPLSQLGLAFAREPRTPVKLTPLGYAMASAPNPVLDGTEESGVLGNEEREFFLEAIRGNAAEVAAVAEFGDLVDLVAGEQQAVDARLQKLHTGWSQAQAVSHRAAMIGRLSDLALAEVDGRGPQARIRLAPDLMQKLAVTDVGHGAPRS